MGISRVANLSFLAALLILLAVPAVFGAITNVALRRPTFSATVRTKGSCAGNRCRSSNAVDGKYPKTNFNPVVCFHSNKVSNPNLRIDLGALTTVENVTLFSVIAKKKSEMRRFNSIQVFIGNSEKYNSASNVECGANQKYYFETFGVAYPFTKVCEGLKGRYVFVVLPKKEYLILCEAQVFGEARSPAPPFSPPPPPNPPPPPPKKKSPPPPKKKSPPPPKKSPPPPPKKSPPPPLPPPPKKSPPPPPISSPPPPPVEGPVSQPHKILLELSEYDNPVNNDYGLLFPKDDMDY